MLPSLRVYRLETRTRLKNCLAVFGDLGFNNATYTLNKSPLHLWYPKVFKDTRLKAVN